MKLKSEITKALELATIINFVDNCESIEDTAVASKMIDILQESQPYESQTIQTLREVVCDLSFDFFINKYVK